MNTHIILFDAPTSIFLLPSPRPPLPPCRVWWSWCRWPCLLWPSLPPSLPLVWLSGPFHSLTSPLLSLASQYNTLLRSPRPSLFPLLFVYTSVGERKSSHCGQIRGLLMHPHCLYANEHMKDVCFVVQVGVIATIHFILQLVIGRTEPKHHTLAWPILCICFNVSTLMIENVVVSVLAWGCSITSGL